MVVELLCVGGGILFHIRNENHPLIFCLLQFNLTLILKRLLSKGKHKQINKNVKKIIHSKFAVFYFPTDS